MSTKISSYNIQSAALASIGGGPKVSSIQITDSGYSVTGASTVSTSGGYVRVNGTGFKSNVNVVLGETLASAVTFISSSQLNVQIPALSTGSYIVYVTNTDDGRVAVKPNGITTA
jgi:hypothetical protein